MQKAQGKVTHVGLAVSANLRHILHFDDLPSWMKVDPYIRHGYRRQLDSIYACFRSLFYIHNEFVNAWSHLAPAIAYTAILLRSDYKLMQEEDIGVLRSDFLIVQGYVACTATCLLFSGIYHTFNAHSDRVAQRFLKLDYLGIALNTVATCVSSTHFGLTAHPKLRSFYITCSLAFACVVFFLVLSPTADGPKAAAWRSILFISLAGSGYIPIVHSVCLEGLKGLSSFPLMYTLAMDALYLLGVFFYLTHLPESRYAGRFDIWGASHQIFHVFVALGQIVYFQGLKVLLHQ
ncbi:hemolysin-III related-domain-containing protein [Macrophomina phaseolina]|uniref:Hemolysin-III related-domain-containing protein n=1 Tax=Macrophomina phaseolina TaxID=35725 RepID=A0ABQ8GSL2_9PEZI|nr:hemolysin-III related-domain-containing protein [Macrophomina phaseolina]